MASPSREGNKICSLPQCGWSSAPVHSWCCCWHSDTGGVMAVGVVHRQKPQHGFHSWDGIFWGKTHFQVVVRTVLPIAISDGRLAVQSSREGLPIHPSSHLCTTYLFPFTTLSPTHHLESTLHTNPPLHTVFIHWSILYTQLLFTDTFYSHIYTIIYTYPCFRFQELHYRWIISRY